MTTLLDSIGDAIHGHNLMAVALSKIVLGRECAAQEIARAALKELDLDAENVLAVHAEFEQIWKDWRRASHKYRKLSTPTTQA